jgi:CheY-like chemotaxis protein
MTTLSHNRNRLTDPRFTPTKRLQPLVLVAEDHADTRFMLRTMLEICGYAVLEAEDGEEAVRLAESSRPDIILMDATLPRLDGLSATRRIHAQLGEVPVIFLSGHAHPAFRATALSAGGTEFLVKPVSLTELERALERQLEQNSERNIDQKA